MVNEGIFGVVLALVLASIAGAVVALRMVRMQAAAKRAEVQGDAGDLPVPIEHADAAIWMTHLDGRLVYANPACAVVFGGPVEPPGPIRRGVHPEDAERLSNALAAGIAAGSYEVGYRSIGGGRDRYIRETGRVVDGEGRYVVCSALDIGAELAMRNELHAVNNRLHAENLRLRENSRRDSLTQCLNRMAFLDQAEKALRMQQRYGRTSTLIFFDLNDFKQLNDNFGHHVGDLGLIEFAAQIRTRLRTTDELGRYGGDEFVALLRETDAAQARQLLVTLAPVVIDAANGNSIILRYSAGIACSDESGIESVDDWLRYADSQMYHQKMRRSTGG